MGDDVVKLVRAKARASAYTFRLSMQARARANPLNRVA